jgi:N-acetylmuramoyl-L-alanine amidase
MEALCLFLLKSIMISGLLTAWYLLGLRGRRLHRYNRFFLLSVLLFSLTIPFLHFRLFDIPHSVSGRFAPVALFGQPAGDLGGDVPAVLLSKQPQTDWVIITGLITAGVSLTFLLILSVKMLKLRKMCRDGSVTRFEGVNLVLTTSPRAPFTFLKYVFWNKAVPLQDEIGRLIFKHELTHIQQGHTYDKLVSQVLTGIFWFNPFYWIIQKELNIVHEFLADEESVGNRDTGILAMMLLQSYNNGSYLVPEHHFFSSPIKRRLAMLQKVAKPSYSALRCIIAVPLIAGITLLFSCHVPDAVAGDIAVAKKKIVLLLDAGHGGKDAGKRSGGYTEKEVCLVCARRIKEFAPAYNIEVQYTTDKDQYVPLADRVAFSDKIRPDVFLSLHVGDEPGNQKEKADFDIYVPGESAYVVHGSNYSNAIFRVMTQDGIIPGSSNSPNHIHLPGCTCGTCVSQAAIQRPRNDKFLSKEKESVYFLNQVKAPGMVMVLGNIKNQEGMRQLTDDKQLDLLCNAILKGIVEGAAVREEFAGNLPNLLAVTPGNSGCR